MKVFIIVILAEFNLLLQTASCFKILKRRQVVIANKYRWPNRQVPYEIASNMDPAVRGIIMSGINEFNTKSCVKWAPKAPSDHNYVLFSFDMNYPGCTCEVGPLRPSKELKMSKNCGNDRGLVMHEMMHCIGFLHEHARDDRDQYIRVNWQNMVPGVQSEFTKASLMYPRLGVHMLGLPYDYNSLMHYKPATYSGKYSTINAFIIVLSVPNPVLEAKQPGITVGNGDTFTEMDLKKISLYYECSGTGPAVAAASLVQPVTQPKPVPVVSVTRSPQEIKREQEQLAKNPFFSDIESEASTNQDGDDGASEDPAEIDQSEPSADETRESSSASENNQQAYEHTDDQATVDRTDQSSANSQQDYPEQPTAPEHNSAETEQGRSNEEPQPEPEQDSESDSGPQPGQDPPASTNDQETDIESMDNDQNGK